MGYVLGAIWWLLTFHLPQSMHIWSDSQKFTHPWYQNLVCGMVYSLVWLLPLLSITNLKSTYTVYVTFLTEKWRCAVLAARLRYSIGQEVLSQPQCWYSIALDVWSNPSHCLEGKYGRTPLEKGSIYVYNHISQPLFRLNSDSPFEYGEGCDKVAIEKRLWRVYWTLFISLMIKYKSHRSSGECLVSPQCDPTNPETWISLATG